MNIRIGALVLCLTVYTAKSLYVGKSGETFDDAQLKSLSRDVDETIQAETIANLLSTTTTTTPQVSSFFNFNKLHLLPMRKMMESNEDDINNNEIEKGDVIEIEVPVIGSEYVRPRKDYRYEKGLEVKDNDASTDQQQTFDTSSSSSSSTSQDDILKFQSDTTLAENSFETTTQAADAEISSSNRIEAEGEQQSKESHIEEIQSVESKLMEQWKAADESSLMDDRFESKVFTIKSRHHPKFPFNVKIVVNNDDEKKSCKSKKSCSQVSFTKRRDIDPQFYIDDSDEDLFFNDDRDRYFVMPNELRSRSARRADEMTPITPAPRYSSQLRGLKKPSFIEELENESSIERSERVNKNLDDLMKFISVWAQVDKFVSDRARGVIKKIAHFTGDDYDDYSVGSRRRVDSKRAIDDPFT